jgi:general secretion pathway protein G
MIVTRQRAVSGFTLIELLVVVVIIGILAALGTMSYLSMIDKARVVKAIGDIKAISTAVDDYWVRTMDYPAGLAVVGENGRLDPWDRPYAYLKIQNPGAGARMDKNLVPINSDYDLYSLGKDGKSTPPLTAKSSMDDVVRANNGGFVGLAANY